MGKAAYGSDNLNMDQVMVMLDFYFRHGVAGTPRDDAEFRHIDAFIAASSRRRAGMTEIAMVG